MGLAAGLMVEAAGLRAFRRLVDSDVRALAGRASQGKAGVVTEGMLGGVPEPVQRYLRYTGIVGKPLDRTVYLRQRGRVRLAGQRWMPLAAREWFSVRPPGFVWDATMRVAGIPVGRARICARAGRAGCWSRWPRWSRWPMSRVRRWTGLDDALSERADVVPLSVLGGQHFLPGHRRGVGSRHSADRGKTATATLLFDAAGRLTNFVARRYAIAGSSRELRTWSVPVTGYGELEGLQLPVQVKAVWKLAEGDREDIDVTLTGLRYDA